MSICKDCFHSYVCEQFNEHRECDNKRCHFANDHFVSTADVVEVVRCKDCKHYIVDQCYHERHEHHQQHIYQEETDFCSYGELKELGK